MEEDQTIFEFPPTIWELGFSSCRYVLNDGDPSKYIFCGKPKHKSSYCEYHYRLCYIPTKALSDANPTKPTISRKHP